jgi:SAM-dependent methyltransferase
MTESRDRLQEFVRWGGPTWLDQVATGIRWLGDLPGRRILEIGARFGGMSVYFATRGAHVVGVDTDGEALARARELGRRNDVSHLTDFQQYSGRPEDLPVGFDVVFSKSTLVLIPDLDSLARGIANSLVPGGKLVAIENARGPLPVHLARLVRWGTLRPYGAGYFTPASVETIGRHLTVELVNWTTLPPTVLVGGVKAQ